MHLIQEVKEKGATKAIVHERAPDGFKVTKSGQIFTINNVEESDKGTYECKAKSTLFRIETIVFTATYTETKGNQFVCNNYAEIIKINIILISHFSNVWNVQTYTCTCM